MAGIGKVVTETLGTLAEETIKATKKVPKRTTFKQVKEAEIAKATPLEKPDILDSDLKDEFTGIRQKDITKQQQYQSGQYTKKQEAIAVKGEELEALKIEEAKSRLVIGQEQADEQAYMQTDMLKREEELMKLYEQRRDIYTKSQDLIKERTNTQILQESPDAKEALYDIASAAAGRGNKFSNIEGRTDALYTRFSAGMTDLKNALRTTHAGLRQNTELANEMIRYMKDGRVKNKALEGEVKKLSGQWTKTAESIKNVRNKAGAQIGKLEDWIIPQSHDKAKIRKGGYRKWQKNILPKLDVKRIEAEQGTDIESVLTTAYKNITSPDVEKGVKGSGSKLTRRGEESRVLHFNTGDDIINYNKDFGNPDVFATMDNHVRSQSNEISMMQILGSNPQAQWDKLKEVARAQGMGTVAEEKLDRLFRVSSGQVDGDDVVDNLDNFMLQAGSTYRGIQIASKLGSATVSSLADLGSIILGAGYRDLSSIKIMGRSLQTLMQESLGSGVSANTKLASRLGVVSEFASASLANSRFAENVGTGFAQKASETVIRASGLGAYTNSLRASFGLELAGNLADNMGKKLDDVPFADMLKEYGIDEAMWAKMGIVKKKNVKNADFFDVTKLYEVDEELGYRVSEMITNEMNAFVIMPGDRTRAWTTWGAKKGTAAGEIARNLTLFKSFPISIVMMHANRWAQMGAGGKTAYAGAAIGTNLILGTMTLWAYDTVTGKTRRSVDRPAMIGEALAKSGGLGIFGDFFIGMTDSRYGQSFSDMILGVPASTLSDITKSAQDLMHKDPDEAVGNIYKRAKNYIPGQNLWYTRALVERSIGDWMGEAIDPNHKKKQRRQAKAMRLRDQKFLFDN